MKEVIECLMENLVKMKKEILYQAIFIIFPSFSTKNGNCLL